MNEIPTIKQIVDSTGMTATEFAIHYRMPVWIMWKWYRGEKQCLELVRDFLVYIIEEEKCKNNTED